jgi:uridine monophosphate synthetase
MELRDAINRAAAGRGKGIGERGEGVGERGEGVGERGEGIGDRGEEGERVAIVEGMLEAGCVKFGSFSLKSGIESPIYIDLRRLVGFPQLLTDVALAFIQVLRDMQFDHLGALPYAALPIATAISLQGDWSMVYPRKEVKSYGTKAPVEGVFQAGEVVVVIDDLISTGGSKIEAIEKLTSAGLVVEDVVVLIDRSPDSGAALTSRGYKLHAVLTLAEILDHYEAAGLVPAEVIDETRDFLSDQGT